MLTCLALAAQSNLAFAKSDGADATLQRQSTGAEFVDEFHTLCPRGLRSPADAEKAFAAAGAVKKRPVLDSFAVSHAPPADLPAFVRLEGGQGQWQYNGPRWVGLAHAQESQIPGGGREVRCKVQMASAQGYWFDWMAQFASRSMPVARTLDDGARVLLFKDRAATDTDAYYVLWRELRPAVPGAKPTLTLEYVVRTDGAAPAPFAFPTPEAAALARIDRYCANAAPAAVATKAAADPGSSPDDSRPDFLRIYHVDSPRLENVRSWVMSGDDEWRLASGQVASPASPKVVRMCGVRMVGLSDSAMERVLRDDPRLVLTEDTRSNGKRLLDFHVKGADRDLIYTVENGPEAANKEHNLMVAEGRAAVKASLKKR